MTLGGEASANGQPNPGGTANPVGQQVNVVCSRGADNVLDTATPPSSAYNADQYAPPQPQPPTWSTTTPLTSTPTPLTSFSSNAYGSVSVVVQTANKLVQPVTYGNPITAGETKPTVRVVLFTPVGGVLNAFILDSATTVSGVPTLDLNSLPTTGAVDFNLLADPSSLPPPSSTPAAPTVSVTGGGSTGGSLAAGTYYAKYQDFVGSVARAPSAESTLFTVAAGNSPTISMPGPASSVTSRNIYLTPPNGASNTETLYASVSAASASSYTLSSAYSPGGAPPSSSTSVAGTFLNVPIGPRAIQAFQYEAATGSNAMVVTKRSPLTILMVPPGGLQSQTLILQ
jgi:hypothetical protein